MTGNTVQMWHALVLQGVKSSNAFPLPKARVVADAVCGAPAQALAAAEEQKLAHQKDAANEQLDSASDWEVCQIFKFTDGKSSVAVDAMSCKVLSCSCSWSNLPQHHV